MKLLIETCLKSYLVALIDEHQTVDYIYVDELKHKSDALDKDVRKLLADKNLNANDLEAIYVTKGPGSFMGVRAGMIYGYTLAKTLKIPFLTCSTLDFISGSVPGTYYIDAKGGLSYSKDFPKGTEKLVDFQPDSPFNIKHFIEGVDDYLRLFKETDKPTLNYMKEPKVN